jgi:predicted anti-sigma-YlaC factor YlaD
MRCEVCRDAESARIDGEDPGVPDEAIDAHLVRCEACRDWSAAARRLTPRARVAPADQVPDLTEAVLRRIAHVRTGRSPRRALAVRVGLAVIAVGQLALAAAFAVPGLLAEHSGHVVHEAAAWNAGLGAGLLAVALQPRRAAGLLPLLSTLVAAVAVVETVDLFRSHLRLATFLPHVLLVAALAIVGWLARASGAPDGGRSADALPTPGPEPAPGRARPPAHARRIGDDVSVATRRSAA